MQFLLYFCAQFLFSVMKKHRSHLLEGLLAAGIALATLCYFVLPHSAAARPTPSETISTTAEQTTDYELPRLTDDRPEQLIRHLGYTVSYNPNWLIPNWVAYELTDSETGGEMERTNKFVPDPLVEGDPVVTADYKNSGYDRGHMAPAADMKWSEQAMRESFYMTNICPQNHNNNAGDWKALEELARDWAHRYGSIYIACGPIVAPDYPTIGTTRRIAVPERFYKVFLRPTDTGWTGIGFVMDNRAGSRPLMTYMQTVDEVESLTGIDFFYLLPDSLEAQAESTLTLDDWLLPRR